MLCGCGRDKDITRTPMAMTLEQLKRIFEEFPATTFACVISEAGEILCVCAPALPPVPATAPLSGDALCQGRASLYWHVRRRCDQWVVLAGVSRRVG
jgi:hypothetical protein